MVDRGAWLVTVYGVTERVRHDLAAQQQQHMCIHTHTHTHTALVWSTGPQPRDSLPSRSLGPVLVLGRCATLIRRHRPEITS